MKKYILIIITMIMLLPIVTSCHDDLDTEPLSNLSPENFITNLDNSEIAVNGVYSVMAEVYQQHFIEMSDLGSHVATSANNSLTHNGFAFYTYDNNHRHLTKTWQTSYKAISRANFVINRVGQLEIDDPLKNRIIAEAKFLRALCYFNLVRFYGDVPLILEELLDFGSLNTDRVASITVYEAIIEDLKFAEEHLFYASWVASENKPSYEAGNLGRATIGAAKGLLAKVYLTMGSHPLQVAGSYQLAYDKAKEIIVDGYYSLDSDYTNLCTIEGETSQEWLFQIQYNVLGLQPGQWGGFHNPLGSGKAIDQGYGRVAPTVKFTKQYEDGDLRFDHNIAKGKINADGSIKYNKKSTLWYTHKYRFTIKQDRFNSGMNAPVLRYADILLMYAEAAEELGIVDQDVKDQLDGILGRAQVTTFAEGRIENDFKEFLFWERARELCFEGHSKFDIVRAGRAKFEAEIIGQEWTEDENNPAKTKIVSWSGNVNPDVHMLVEIPAAELSGAQ